MRTLNAHLQTANQRNLEFVSSNAVHNALHLVRESAEAVAAAHRDAEVDALQQLTSAKRAQAQLEVVLALHPPQTSSVLRGCASR